MADSPEDLRTEIARLRAQVQETLELWQRPDHIRLHAGEMSRQEMRAVLAVVGAIAKALAVPGGPA
jgi:hypothetical protein